MTLYHTDEDVSLFTKVTLRTESGGGEDSKATSRARERQLESLGSYKVCW